MSKFLLRKEVAEINRLGMTKVTASAFRRSIANANIRVGKRVDYLLIDAFFIRYITELPVGYKKVKRGPKHAKLDNITFQQRTGLKNKCVSLLRQLNKLSTTWRRCLER